MSGVRGTGDRDDYFGGDYLQDIAEIRLTELGGQELLDAGHNAARAYVAEAYPWDGEGDEPPERVSAYIAMLWQVGDAAEPTVAQT
jgi:hypothetical protein